MNILLSTYNYYPYHWGGSEVYVHGLAKFLKQKGHTVKVVAAVHKQVIESNKVESVYLKSFSYLNYKYDDVDVIGVSLNSETTEEIYSKFNSVWKTDWKLVLDDHFKKGIDLFHLHGFSSVSGLALLETVKEKFPDVKIFASYHTPMSCPKGTLLLFDKVQCEIKPTVRDCTSCSIQHYGNVSISTAKLIAFFLPEIKFSEKYPTSLSYKYYIRKGLDSFSILSGNVDHWFCFSNQIKNNLKLNGISEIKISMLRHGINDFFFDGSTEIIRNNSIMTFVFMGRFELIKGFHTLLSSWLSLPVSEVRKLIIIGENQSDIPEINKLISDAEKRTDIIFAGKKEQTEIRQILLSSHCVVIPSEWVEIGPLVFHEAVATGCNVIASNIGGNKELSEFYKDGCTEFKFGDAVDLRRTILDFKFIPIKKVPLSQNEHYSVVFSNYIKQIHDN